MGVDRINKSYMGIILHQMASIADFQFRSGWRTITEANIQVLTLFKLLKVQYQQMAHCTTVLVDTAICIDIWISVMTNDHGMNKNV